jgi:iron complex outermembrane receptor protein
MKPISHRRSGGQNAVIEDSRKLLLRRLIALSLAAPVLPAFAQAPETAVGQLEEILVTANRRAETVLSVPYNITAASEEDLNRAGTTDFTKLAQLVPGLVSNGGGIRSAGTTNGLSLRGLNLDNSDNDDVPPITVPTVATYIGETPIFTNLRITDVKRVEVLRGPQGTLYGSGSEGGTIRFIFNEPDPTRFSASVKTDASHTNHARDVNYDVDGVLNLPITDTSAVRFSAGHTLQAGYITATNLYALGTGGVPLLANPADPVHSLPVKTSKTDINGADLTYARVSLKFDIGNLKVLAMYQHQEESADDRSADAYPGGPVPTAFSSTVTPGFLNNGFDAAFQPTYKPYQTGIFLLEPYKRRVDLGSVELSADLGFGTITSATSYYDNRGNAFEDNSGFYQTSLGFLYSGMPRPAVLSDRNYLQNSFVEEVRLVSPDTGPLKWVGGAFYQNQHDDFSQVDTFLGWSPWATASFGAPVAENRAFIYDRQMHFQDKAVFGELSYHLTDRWQVTGGLRAFDQSLSINALTALPICGVFCSGNANNPTDNVVGANDQGKKDVLWKFNTSYNIAADLMGYFNYSEGFRRGGANGVPTTGPVGENPAFLTFKPDRVKSYEVGLKGAIDERVQFTAAVFVNEWLNPQLNISTPKSGFFAAINGDSARTRGIELQTKYRATHDLTVSLGYSYLDAKLTAPVNIVGYNFGSEGQALPGVPKHQISTAGDFEHPISGNMSLTAHLDGSFRDKTTTSLQKTFNVPIDSFWIWNGSIGLEKSRWRSALFVDNIGDVRGVTTAPSPVSYGPRHAANRLSPPLTIGLRLSYKTE